MKSTKVVALLLLTAVLVGKSACLTKKPYILSVLSLIPVTGDEPRKGDACRAGIDILVDEVNNRNDILPNYNVEPVYDDEGPWAGKTTNAVFAFKTRFESLLSSNATYHMSPLMVGPFFSGGCLAAAKFIHWSDIVMLAIGCSTPQGTANRRIFPNLYKTRITGELVAYAQLHFIREIGKWNRFGILTNAGNIFDYTLAGFLMKVALEEKFEVSYFDCVPDLDDNTILSLKQSETKVIVLDAGIPGLVVKFLCQTYKFGMTGSRYVFIFHAAAYFEPTGLSNDVGVKGCYRSMIFEQLEISFWIGWSLVPAPDVASTLRSSLGISLSEFEARYNNYTKNVRLQDYDKRLLCHDSMLQGVLALDNAEKMLSLRNMSLRDYRTSPTEVMKAVNESLAKIDYTGYRIGRFKYSERLELDADIQTVTSWTQSNNLQLLAEVSMKENESLYNYSSYKTRLVQRPLWITPKKTPTKDRASVIISLIKTPIEFSWCIVALASCLGVLQLAAAVKALYSPQSRNIVSLGKVFPIFGSLLLNVASGLFAAAITTASPHVICILQRIFCTMGLTFVHGYTSFCMLFFSTSKSTRQQQRPPTSSRRTSTRRISSVTSRASLGSVGTMIANLDPVAKEIFVATALLTFALLSAGYLAVWLSIENPKYATLNTTPIPVYTYETDSYETINVLVCKSDYDLVWIAPLAIFHVILLAAGSLAAFKLRGLKTAKEVICKEYGQIHLSLICVSTLFVGGILIVVVLNSPIGQLIALAIVTLLISGAITGIFFKALVKP